MAERLGFEPRVPEGTTVFETAAFDHSATSPSTESVKATSVCPRQSAFGNPVD